MNSEWEVWKEAVENLFQVLFLNLKENNEENHENVNKFSQISDRNLKPGFPHYEAGKLSTRR